MKLPRLSALVAVGVLSVLTAGRLTWSAVTVSDAQVPPEFEEVPAIPDGPGGSPYLPDGPGPSYFPDEPGYGDGCGFEPCGPSYWMHRGGFFGEYLHLRPRDVEVTFAETLGPEAVVDSEFDSGFRVGYIKCLDDRSSLALKYTDFESEATDAVTVGQSTAASTYGIDFKLVDLDYRAVLDCGDHFMVNYLVGLRYAKLDQDLYALVDTIEVDTGEGADIDFEGGGIRLGLEGERYSCFGGLFLYGRGDASFVAGEFRANYSQTIGSQPVLGGSDWESGRVISMFDLELGIGWMGPSNNWRFTAGYLFSSWFNVVKTEDFLHAVNSNNFNDLDDMLTFDGLSIRLEYRK